MGMRGAVEGVVELAQGCSTPPAFAGAPSGAQPSSETSVNKLLRGILEIPMADLAMSLLGNEASGMGEWQFDALNFHGTVIGGGSPNIQRNIIAERVLGLPKD